MAVNYVIAADVIDVTVDSPKPEDIFLVDSNVWYWMTYTRASQASPRSKPMNYQTLYYPAFVNKVIATSAKLYQAICVVRKSLWFKVVTKSSNCIYPTVLL